MKNKYDEIDALRFYAKYSKLYWDEFIKACTDSGDLERLKSTIYGLRLGVSKMISGSLPHGDIVKFCGDKIRDMERAAENIFKKKYSNRTVGTGTTSVAGMIERDRVRKAEIDRFMRESNPSHIHWCSGGS